MNNIVITGVKILGKGSKGLTIDYSDISAGAINYHNTVKRTSPKPVSTDFTVAIAALKKHVRKFFRLDKSVQENDITILEVSNEPNGYYLTVSIATAVDNAHAFKMKSCLIMEDNYSDYNTLVDDYNEVRKEVTEYVLGKTKEDPNQYLHSLISNGKMKDVSLEELDQLSEVEKHQKMVDYLSENGAMFLMTGLEDKTVN